MNPFRSDLLTPFGIESGDPMEEVLALQSYSVSSSGAAVDCISDVSCQSIASCRSDTSGVGGATQAATCDPNICGG